MPVQQGRDSKGSYYQWGNQKKYYYTPNDPKSRSRARHLAEEQGKAIEANKE